MIKMVCKVDQPVHIGEGITVTPTDIDEKSVRLIAKGRTLGGADDGAAFEKVLELSRNQSTNLGPMIAVAVLEVLGDKVRLGVSAPANLTVTAGQAKP
jgi:sRNA-binding carbon storage regulator CsrA